MCYSLCMSLNTHNNYWWSWLFFSATILKVTLGVRFLISELVVDSMYKGYTKGLMGNFDGNATNDFMLPNNTILDANTTSTERQIYHNFGQQCKDEWRIFWNFLVHHVKCNNWIILFFLTLGLVYDKSLFHYDKGLSHLNFSHLDFEPIFLDEVAKETLENAKTKCGPLPSQACIFDYLATGDIALAESSGTEDAAAQSDMKIIG